MWRHCGYLNEETVEGIPGVVMQDNNWRVGTSNEKKFFISLLARWLDLWLIRASYGVANSNQPSTKVAQNGNVQSSIKFLASFQFSTEKLLSISIRISQISMERAWMAKTNAPFRILFMYRPTECKLQKNATSNFLYQVAFERFPLSNKGKLIEFLRVGQPSRGIESHFNRKIKWTFPFRKKRHGEGLPTGSFEPSRLLVMKYFITREKFDEKTN